MMHQVRTLERMLMVVSLVMDSVIPDMIMNIAQVPSIPRPTTVSPMTIPLEKETLNALAIPFLAA